MEYSRQLVIAPYRLMKNIVRCYTQWEQPRIHLYSGSLGMEKLGKYRGEHVLLFMR